MPTIPDWITYSPSSGSGSGQITITANTNTELQERLAQLMVYNSQYGITAVTQISQDICSVTGLNVTVNWIKDIPASGGTATSANCSFQVFAVYSDGNSVEVTDDCIISGSKEVNASTNESRHSIGTVYFTVVYPDRFTTNATVVGYQAAYVPDPVVLNNITATAVWATDVPASGGIATSANCTFTITAYYSDGSTQVIPASQCSISGSMNVNPSTDGERHNVGNITFNVSYEGKSTTCSATVYQAAYQAVFNGDVVITYWASPTAGTSEEVTLFYTGGSQIVGFKVDDDDTIYDSSTTSMTFDTNVFHTVTYEFKNGIIDWRTFMNCDRILKAEIGESINTINGYAFFGCDFLTAATLPDTLVELGGSMFGQTAIKNPVIPDSVTQMGTDVFRSCENIDTCTIGSGLTEIPKNTFYSSTISAITIPSNIEAIGYSAFSYCENLQSVDFEEGCQVISGYAFQNTDKLVNIEFPNSLREIGSRAFERSGLKSVAIPIYVEEIGSNAFGYCNSLTGVSIGAKIVGEAAFFWCTGLTSVAMNNGVEEIGGSVFTNCSNLNSISLPSTIKSIGKWAFSSLPYGFSLTCMASTPPAAADEFIDISNWQGWIYVPSGSVTAYKTASGWSNYASRIIAA